MTTTPAPSAAAPTADVGVVGMAVMGSNLARNFASHGYTVAVYNRTPARTPSCPPTGLGDVDDILTRWATATPSGADAVSISE